MNSFEQPPRALPPAAAVDRLGARPTPSPQRPGWMRSIWVAAVALGLGAATGACLAIRAPDSGRARAEEEPLDPWSREGRVPVRLSESEGLLVLEVESASGRRVRCARDGDRVRVERPGEPAELLPWVRIEAEPGASGVRYEGRLYPGALIVEPRSSGGLGIANWAPLEDYIEGVVAAELVLWSAGRAAIAAQAIAARSYALSTLEVRQLNSRRPELWDDTRDQSYRGRFQPDSAASTRGLDRLLSEAVASSRGRVLEYSGRVFAARYHACCGGRTAAEADVFQGLSGPSLSVVCEPCMQASERARNSAQVKSGPVQALPASSAAGAGPLRTAFDPSWSYTAPQSQLSGLARSMGLGERLIALAPTRIDAGERWLEVELKGNRASRRISLNQLRQQLGFGRLRSGRILTTWPRPGQPIQDGMFFSGLGSGHGVGLCQRGAIGYGELGLDANRILKHYYPGAQVVSR